MKEEMQLTVFLAQQSRHIVLGYNDAY